MLKSRTFTILQFLVFLFLLAAPMAKLSAQTFNKGVISGKLVDERQVSLPFASVFLKNAADSAVYKSIISEENGLFVFSAVKEGSYILEVKMIGFETLIKANVRIDAANPVIDLGNLPLITSAKLLNGVTINSKTPFIERQADKIVVNLNNSLNAGSSVMEVMDRLPGVQVSPSDQITLNGRGVQIYIDGKLTPLSAEALASLLKGMASANIQKIELIAHPSSKYDAAGNGGVINIVKKRNHKEGASGNVYGGGGVGKYGKQNGGLNLNFKDKSYNVLLNTNYSFNKYFGNSSLVTDFYTPDQVLDRQSVAQINSIRKIRTFAPNLGADLYLSKKTTLSFSVTESAESLLRDAQSLTNDFNALQAGTGSSDFKNLVKTKTNNFSSGMHLLHQIDTLGKEYTIDADYFSYGSRIDQHNTNTLYAATGNLLNTAITLFDQDRNFNAYSVKADYTNPFKGGGKLDAGLKSSYVISNNSNQLFDSPDVLNATSIDRFRYTENINALYATYSKGYKKLSYQLGLRGESTLGKGTQLQTGETVDKSYVKLFPSAFLDYKFNDNHSLNLTFNKRIERPNYENLNPLIRIINSNNYAQGNPGLQPVISYNASATYAFRNALSFGFHYDLNLHDFTTVSSVNENTGITTTGPVNNKHTQYFGLYITYTKQVTPWWFTSSQVNFRQQSFQSTVNGYGYNSPGLLAVNVDNYDTFGITKKFFLDVLYRYRGKSQERTVTNDANSYITAGLRKVFKKGSIGFNVTDIFNSYTSRYVQNSVSVRQLWDNNYETRVYRLNFTYNFGGNIKRTKTSTGADNEKSRTSTKEN